MMEACLLNNDSCIVNVHSMTKHFLNVKHDWRIASNKIQLDRQVLNVFTIPINYYLFNTRFKALKTIFGHRIDWTNDNTKTTNKIKAKFTLSLSNYHCCGIQTIEL